MGQDAEVSRPRECVLVEEMVRVHGQRMGEAPSEAGKPATLPAWLAGKWVAILLGEQDGSVHGGVLESSGQREQLVPGAGRR